MLKTQQIESAQRIDSWRNHFELALEASLPAGETDPARLHQAMRYSALGGGKRIRPMLVYAATHALGHSPALLDALACALELIHAYSLIHDDLPAMDDDDLRRGQATCHLAFDEATAILAGDALQALAFGQLSTMTDCDPRATVELMNRLSQACGSTGMAGGQMLDLSASGREISLADLEHIHHLKTGALISLSVTGPAVFTQAPEIQINALERFGACVGLGFQIRDDILDVTGDKSKTGKPVNSDADRNQPTFPRLIGLEASIERANHLLDEALASLDKLPGDVNPLASLAIHMIQRDH